ncbi:hypothetical protein [Arthrobacter antioxidans]|uniref:hypothetical protein n=1 Tax=Arthrobacter antioxidans TaxID=2895818 RepID=UPI001FFF41FF|nr:hypothetical protein [Arthrobacter antioxidans]
MNDPTPPVQPADHEVGQPVTPTRTSPPPPITALKWVSFLAVLAPLALYGLFTIEDLGWVNVLSAEGEGMTGFIIFALLLLGTVIFTLAYLLTVILTRRRYAHRGFVHYTTLGLGLLILTYQVVGMTGLIPS